MPGPIRPSLFWLVLVVTVVMINLLWPHFIVRT
jgi:hypothetical protein